MTSALSESELYTRWRHRWDDFLTDVEEAAAEERVVDALRDKVIIGNAERKIAGGHEGREMLELLQNARDAIREGRADTGTVYVGVYDEGVLVANTGSRFDFFDPQVENAVTMIGETGKGDEEDDRSIGHKGVGLKSILASGDSFEIFTRPDRGSDEILGVRLSRSYLLSALLTRLGHDTDVASLVSELNDDDLVSIIRDGASTEEVRLTAEIRDDLSKLPLFNFPVPLSLESSSTGTDHIARQARALLRGETTEGISQPIEEPFRTVVFVRFEDEDWRDLLEQRDIPLPEDGKGDPENRANLIWQYLAQTASTTGLQPETLVQLDYIDGLHLERMTGGSESPERVERWDISRSHSGATRLDEIVHSDVHVDIYTDETPQAAVSESFDQFTFSSDRDHGVRLLMNKASRDDEHPIDLIEEYPLYLYYPIQNTTTTPFPFCLHGQFRVETNRKDLSTNNLEHNQAVLAEALDLIELVATETASATLRDSSPYGSLYPWILLPQIRATQVSEPTTQGELLDWFSTTLLERLRDAQIIPTNVGDTHRPEKSLLHWEREVLSGYVALYAILDDIDHNDTSLEEESSIRPIPSVDVLTSYQGFPAAWDSRLESLLTSEEAARATRAIAKEWAETLANSLARGATDQEAISCPASPARNLLIGTVRLLTEATDGDDDLVALLGDTAEAFDGTYLLPCKIRDEDPDERLFLTQVERRRSPVRGRRETTRSRSVIWNVDSATRTTDRPPTPPESTNFTVYFLNEPVQEKANINRVLGLSGQLWGLREYEGIPSFFRSLLDAFAGGSHETVEPLDFAFVAALIDRLGRDSGDLQADEGSFFPLSYLQTAVEQTEGDQRQNLNRRVDLRDCSIQLPTQTEPLSISNTVLPDEWQRLRSRATVTDPDYEVDEDWAAIEPEAYPGPTWVPPASQSWQSIRERIKRSITDEELATTLSLFGASTLPGIQIVWMYGDGHPPMQGNPSWNPIEWDTTITDSKAPARLESLHDALSELDGTYQELITSPGYHPSETADHSSKCNVKLDRRLADVNLASWIWISNTDVLEDRGPAVREVLRRHGGDFVESLLQTGWSCNHGHNRRTWTDTVPSLLNWQLRQLSVWEHVVDTHDDVQKQWGPQISRLRYAVRLESSRGAQAARMFPHVTNEVAGEYPGRLLGTLGVKPVDGLNVTEAADHLQTLQSVLAEAQLDSERPVPLSIPGDRTNDWLQAYTQLLQPLLRRLPEDDAEAEPLDFPFLTHLPVLQADTWLAAPIDWIRRHASDRIRHYEDQSPKPWEKQAIQENDYFVLRRTAVGPFRRLARALGVEQVDASKLVLESGEIELRGDNFEARLDEFRRSLFERRDLLVASTERTDEDEIRKTADEVAIAIRGLDIARRFPDSALEQLSDPTSALYKTTDGGDALLFNEDAVDGDLTLDDLAMGLALLVERPTKVATFREALQTGVGVRELESRWEQRTFPVTTVKNVLRSQDTREFEAKIDAVSALLEQLTGDPIPNRDEAITAVAEINPATLESIERWLAVGESPGGDSHVSEEIDELVMTTRDRVPDELEFCLEILFGDTKSGDAWIDAMEDAALDGSTEEIVISWLENHRSILHSHPFDPEIRARYARVLVLKQVLERTDPTELIDLEIWRSRIDAFRSSDDATLPWTSTLPEDIPPEVDGRPRLFYLTKVPRLQSIVDSVIADIEDELPDGTDGWEPVLRQYIENGSFPEIEDGSGNKQFQDKALSDIATSVESETDPGFFSAEEISGPDFNTREPSVSVSTGSSNLGGGSSQFRGRGQQAEAFVMAWILDRAGSWLEESPHGVLRHFRSGFRRLYRDQQNRGYKWHVHSRWENSLLDLLDDPDSLSEESILDWRESLQQGARLAILPFIQLINVTLEQGPGFDVIDPFGPISREASSDGFGLAFTPVEIKAVDGTEPPFNFRLTTNEYRQCKSFIEEADVPYVIRLVSVPEPDTPDWPQHCTVTSEKVMDTVDDLESMIAERGFERVVKGGYMNMSIE